MTNAITIKKLNYQYADERPLFTDFSLTIAAGSWVAIVGQNGSGKSTLAKLILGLLTPTKDSQMAVFGVPVTTENLRDVRDQIGMVFQNPDNQFVGTTVADDIAFGLENHQVPTTEMPARITDALALVGMSAFADREPHTLSGGQKQRVAIASVLALAPKMIILDEATAMLDPQGRAAIIDVLQELKAQFGNALTIVTITHDMNEAALADRVVVLNQGAIAADETPTRLFTDQEKVIANGLELPLSGQIAQRLQPTPATYLNESDLIAWILRSKT